MKLKAKAYGSVKPAIIALAAAAMLLIFPAEAVAGIRSGLEACLRTIIPSLFPFLVLSSYIVRSGAHEACSRLLSPVSRFIFGLPGNTFGTIVMGFSGGYPVGAKMTAQLYENGSINKQQAQRMMLFCVNPGPAFVVSAVGYSMLGSAKTGAVIFASLLGSSLIIGILSRFAHLQNQPAAEVELCRISSGHSESVLTDSVSDGAACTVSVCTWILLFACLCSVIQALPLSDGTMLLIRCAAEVTAGCEACTGRLGIPVIAAILGWGGFSVHFQVLPYLRKTSTQMSKYLACRLINSALSAFICGALLRLFPDVSQVFAPSPYSAFVSSVSVPAALSLIIAAILLVLEVDMSRKMC